MAEASSTKSLLDPLIIRLSKGQWLINSVSLGALFLACAFTTVIQGSTNQALGWILLVVLGALSGWSIWFAFSKRTRLELSREGFAFYTPTATGALSKGLKLALPDTYVLHAQALAELISGWRAPSGG